MDTSLLLTTKYGVGAYLALKSHYLGTTFQARLQSRADQVLETTYYDGTKRHFTLEKYSEMLQHAFVDLESAGEQVSEERKVRVLLNGISDPRHKSAKHQVIASEHLQETFYAVTNYITHVLDSEVSYSATTRKSWISAFKSNNNDHTNSSRNTRRGKRWERMWWLQHMEEWMRRQQGKGTRTYADEGNILSTQ